MTDTDTSRAVALGKRKERDEAFPQGSTLFVSNLPYTATSVDLETLFSEVAPVRSAFVVLEQGTGVSKGVGYVSFAIKEDAASSYEIITKDGIKLNGRNLRVQWPSSKKKKSETEEADIRASSAPKDKSQRPRLPKANLDSNAVRTIVVSGLPSGLDAGTLWKKIRKCAGAESLEWPSKNEAGEEDAAAAQVLFDTSNHAQDAVLKLHAHVYKSSLLSVTLKKRLETLSHVRSSAKSAPSRSSRLIIRNLPFNISAQDLRAVFLPFGPIHAIDIPQTSEGKGRGFAFVWMLSRKDAEKALESTNGKQIQAGIAEGLVSDKQKRKKVKREEKKKLLEAAPDQDEDEDMAIEQTASGSKERLVAVDWALSKEKWEEEKSKGLSENGLPSSLDSPNDDDDSSGSSSGSSDGDTSDDSDSDGEEHIGVHEDSDVDQDRDEDEEDVPVKPSLPPPEAGSTLFIRNIPFEATDADLRSLFTTFGPLRYARITMDSATGRSRGTGFACFWNVAHADAAVDQSARLRADIEGTAHPLVSHNPFTMPSILTPDPSSRTAANLVLQGRTLDVVRAVTREDATKLKEKGERAREKADKRNVYLLREGVVMPNTPAAANLTPADIERRTSSFNARRALLKSNPQLFISKTRLSIRQLPLFVTERILKRLAIHAVKDFEKDVAGKTRNPLTDAELEEDERDESEPKKSRTKSKFERSTGVKQAKIVRQQERVDAVTNKGRSKGYGFLELLSHADALRVLRWANNNPSVGGLLENWWTEELADLLEAEKSKEVKDPARIKRLTEEVGKGTKGKGKGANLIVEFSIENSQVVGRRKANQNRPNNPEQEPVGKPARKTKVEGPAQKVVPDDTPSKVDNALGSMIGRKRKQRKTGRK